jgi:hypothetical protein
MNLSSEFYPPKRRGLIFHISFALILAAAGGYLFWLAVEQEVNSFFLLLMLGAILILVPIPILVYRAYSLRQSRYLVDRQGLRLRWGLRAEDIPFPEIEWARPASELAMDLPLPRFSTPGAIVGSRIVQDLGMVEYFASDPSTMILIATYNKIYVISPEDKNTFLAVFSRMVEMGSPSPLQSYSALPVVFFRNVWTDRMARLPLIIGIALTIGLFILVAAVIPTMSSISLGFNRLGQPLEAGPPARLLLLPILAAFTLTFDVLAGLFFYRRPRKQSIAYLLWTSSSIVPILLIIATLFML